MSGIEKKVNNVVTETTSYSYDNNGNQLVTTVTPYLNGVPQTPVVTATNTYDDFNQLTQTVAGSTTVDNTYNGEGYRVEKTVGTNVTKYLYEADKVILEVDGSNNQTGRNMYGINLLTRTAGGATLDYLYNGHADVTALINSSGTVAGSYYYDAFGNIVEQTGTANNSINYAGYQYDPESKTYYLNARFYDPTTARFLQEDVVRGDVKDPLSLNLYTYCHNEPIMYTDPTGHIYESDKKYLGYNNGYVYHQLEELGIEWQEAKGNAARQAEIKAQADQMRGIADVQIELYLQNYAGVDGNRITVDGSIGKNTAGALNYYTSYSHRDDLSAQGIGVYDPKRRDIDGALYNYIVTHGVYNGTSNTQVPKQKQEYTFKQGVTDFADAELKVVDSTVNMVLHPIDTGFAIVHGMDQVLANGAEPYVEKFDKYVYDNIITGTAQSRTKASGTACATILSGAALGEVTSTERLTAGATLENSSSSAQGLLKKYGIPSTLTDEEIAAANEVSLQMSLKKIEDSYLKKKGIDAHELKSDFVGNKNISKYDLYVETDTGEIFIYQKGAKGQGIATGEYIK